MIGDSSTDPNLCSIFKGYSNKHQHPSSPTKSLIMISSPPISLVALPTLSRLTRFPRSLDPLLPSLVIPTLLSCGLQSLNSIILPYSSAQYLLGYLLWPSTFVLQSPAWLGLWSPLSLQLAAAYRFFHACISLCSIFCTLSSSFLLGDNPFFSLSSTP